jgi:hypothetical protein
MRCRLVFLSRVISILPRARRPASSEATPCKLCPTGRRTCTGLTLLTPSGMRRLPWWRFVQVTRLEQEGSKYDRQPHSRSASHQLMSYIPTHSLFLPGRTYQNHADSITKYESEHCFNRFQGPTRPSSSAPQAQKRTSLPMGMPIADTGKVRWLPFCTLPAGSRLGRTRATSSPLTHFAQVDLAIQRSLALKDLARLPSEVCHIQLGNVIVQPSWLKIHDWLCVLGPLMKYILQVSQCMREYSPLLYLPLVHLLIPWV